MVKTRLTVTHADKRQTKYKGIIDCFRVVYREEGVLAFYKGMSTSIIGVIPFAGGTFMAYEFLDKLWRGYKGDKPLNPLENFINGCLAAAFAQTFSFPFDTIRKKMQAKSHTVTEDMKPDVEFTGMIDAFVKTVQKHGVLGLWRGTTANLAKVAPYAGIMFAAFEACKRFFVWWNGFTTTPFKVLFSNTHTHTHTITHTHTHTHTLSHTHTHTHTITHTHTHTHTHTLSHTHSHYHTHKITISQSNHHTLALN
jgi:solute carrier family 25 protein 43